MTGKSQYCNFALAFRCGCGFKTNSWTEAEQHALSQAHDVSIYGKLVVGKGVRP